jgi:metallophosphoesterase (TIGR00282 family)
MRVLFLGDIVGKEGRRAVITKAPRLREEYRADVLIVNGENSAAGAGITPKCAEELYESGVDLITTGNHIWNRREIMPYLTTNQHRLIRPANYSDKAPGSGAAVVTTSAGKKLLVLNLSGRVFMPILADCPFRTADELLAEHSGVDAVIVDFHAEATSEKAALAHYLDGRVAALIGTHTHVQTADERILPKGTAFITDVGMCGSFNSIIGVEIEPVVKRFREGTPERFSAAAGEAKICGVLVESDCGRAVKIERLVK